MTYLALNLIPAVAIALIAAVSYHAGHQRGRRR